MELKKHIESYLENPFPLWDNELTDLLVAYKWNELSSRAVPPQIYKYSITGSYLEEKESDEITIPISEDECDIVLAIPTKALQNFYEEHGLVATGIANQQAEILNKVKGALAIFQSVPRVFAFLNKIVKSIQIIDAEWPDTDVSYSHPEIPFSIFFSVCNENSIISNLRVAESILHEAMHLKLTLIEKHIELIELNSIETFYSPWREEPRPLRGVIHGIYVFKAIKDFYMLICQAYSINSDEYQFIKFRIVAIEKELALLKDFPITITLTHLGKQLSIILLS